MAKKKETKKVTPKKKENKATPWDTLKREFILNEKYSKPRTWLREVQGWDEKKLESGNTIDHITEWGKERADFQLGLLEEAKEDIKQIQAKRIPELMKAKLNIVVKAMNLIEADSIVIKNKNGKLISVAPDTKALTDVYKIIKTELGEPTSINKNYNRELDNDEETELTDDEFTRILKRGKDNKKPQGN